MDCSEVKKYLDRLASGQQELDHDVISDHVIFCSSCYDTVMNFFRLMEAPSSGYLEETVNDLTGAIYGLSKALIRDRSSEDDSHQQIRYLSQPESTEHYMREGSEMIDDVQDYTGAEELRGSNTEDIREMIETSRERQVDIVVRLLDKAIELDGEFSADCLNLKGVLLISQSEFSEAEACFRAIMKRPRVDLYHRKLQLLAMNNLAYLRRIENDLDGAIKLAERSKVFAAEFDGDDFGSRFALMFFYLLRGAETDIDRAAEEVGSLTATESTREEFFRFLKLDHNSEIREIYERHVPPLGAIG